MIILAVKYLPKGIRRPAASLDIRGVILLALSILFGMLAVTTLGTAGVQPVGSPLRRSRSWPRACWAPSSCAIPGAAPLRSSPVRLLLGRSFLVMNIVNVLFGTAVLGFSALVPLYAQNRYHLPLASAGTLLTARAIGTVCVAGLAAMMLRRTGCRLPMVVGFSAIAFGLVMLAVEAPRACRRTCGWRAGRC